MGGVAEDVRSLNCLGFLVACIATTVCGIAAGLEEGRPIPSRVMVLSIIAFLLHEFEAAMGCAMTASA